MRSVHHICTEPPEQDTQLSDSSLELPLMFGPVETTNESSAPQKVSLEPQLVQSIWQPAYHFSSEGPVSRTTLRRVIDDDGYCWPVSNTKGSLTPAINMTLKCNLLGDTQSHTLSSL